MEQTKVKSLVLKIKTRSGETFIHTLPQTSTIGIFKSELSKITSITPGRLHVLSGFPPRPLNLNDEDSSLEASNINSGDTLIVEEVKEASSVKPIKSADHKSPEPTRTSETRRHTDHLSVPGILLKKVVPADNSCLFTSIGFVLGGHVDVTCGTYMRQIIAEAVAADPENYNEAILGRPNQDYCTWIQEANSWGGAIELSILSKFYGLEIDVVDTVNAIINRFGEDQLYDHRVFLIFDGIHYDPLYLEPLEPNETIQTVFPTTDDKILQDAETLALEAQASRQFTDVNKFSLRCEVCNIYLIGQNEALAHAKETGHSSFGEVNR